MLFDGFFSGINSGDLHGQAINLPKELIVTVADCNFILDILNRASAYIGGADETLDDDELEYRSEIAKAYAILVDEGWERNHYKAMLKALSKANSALDTALHYEMGEGDYRSVYDAFTSTNNIINQIQDTGDKTDEAY